mmetsp:Transcript_27929/g.63181  ORF Transcript_27929/g.63181 Transcript_27929/m.63181 type:complete len:100 (+) Transcript_27929:94-393(+)|eukprot:CAMPEP_0197918898 /NCGR_PEP_ID=MMETSP1439-20131203/86250_1 /TAXON_ID=66791 /ORGANISM="Gonyaulax spinifera, Strain CCMP409" /LENGTH=99 /DNA_ID=CAMNT_0043541043 /DNA_START=88 /DNA_END=387 /DNA_ORIENTATION=+
MGLCSSLLTADNVKSASKQIMERYDKDGSGTLHAGEVKEALKAALGSLGEQVPLDSAMEQVDADGSGDLDLAEFQQLIFKALKRAGVNVSGADDVTTEE